MKVKHYDLFPITKWHTNSTLKGFGDVVDLPITKFPGLIISVWKVKSVWWRVRFLFSGEVSFMCQGATHPPISIIIGESVIKNKGESKNESN